MIQDEMEMEVKYHQTHDNKSRLQSILDTIVHDLRLLFLGGDMFNDVLRDTPGNTFSKIIDFARNPSKIRSHDSSFWDEIYKSIKSIKNWELIEPNILSKYVNSENFNEIKGKMYTHGKYDEKHKNNVLFAVFVRDLLEKVDDRERRSGICRAIIVVLAVALFFLLENIISRYGRGIFPKGVVGRLFSSLFALASMTPLTLGAVHAVVYMLDKNVRELRDNWNTIVNAPNGEKNS